MVILFILSWVLSLGFTVFGIVYFIIGITYKNWRKIVFSLISLVLGVACYYLPSYILIETVVLSLKK